MIYYFIQHRVPLISFSADRATARRVLVVVNESHHQTLSQILNPGLLKELGYPAAKKIRSYDTATIYQFDRVM